LLLLALTFVGIDVNIPECDDRKKQCDDDCTAIFHSFTSAHFSAAA
jgi:hypothetical protein